MAISLANFQSRLIESGLMTGDALRAFLEASPADQAPTDGEQLARALVKARKLTAYQAQLVYQGKGRSLVMGNYVVLDKLGQGGMGMVLKAEHQRMQRIVALKVLSPNVVKTPDLLERFQREVRAAARLNHQNIVAAYDADEANGTHYLVMEYVEGTDLSAFVKKRGPLPVQKAIECIAQAGRGLQYAHEHGVIHRDIKPANLLLSESGTVKILDMGLARIESADGPQTELTSTGAVMGTVDYMAPEQALSTKDADARSDQYSLGISLWYLLTGKAAYQGDSLMARLLAHREAPIPSLSAMRQDVPKSVEAIFEKMVAKKAEDRYPSMAEAVADLESCLSGEASLPSMSSGPSEDSKLDVFLGELAAPVVGRPSTTATTHRPTPAVKASGHTLSSSDVSEVTDPHTKTVAVARARPRRRGGTSKIPKRPALWSGVAGLVLLMGIGSSFFWKAKATPEPTGDASTAERPISESDLTGVPFDPAEMATNAFPGQRDAGLEFPAGEGYVSLPLRLSRNTPMTVEAWVTPSQSAEDQVSRRIWHAGGIELKQYGRNWDLIGPGRPGISLQDRMVSGYGGAIPGVRTHLAAVLTRAGLALFVDGKLAQRREYDALPDSPQPMFLGSSEIIPAVTGGYRAFAGTIHEVRISNGDRYRLDNFMPPETFESDAATMALYRMSEGSGDVLQDLSEKGHDGTIVGGNWVGGINIATRTDSAMTIDLLSLVDPQRDALLFNDARNRWENGGGWARQASGWQSGLGRRELLRLPHAPTAPSYSLTVDLQSVGGNGGLWIVLPVGAVECFFAYNGFIRGNVASAGFGYVDDKPENQNDTTVSHPVLPIGQSVRLNFDVDLAGSNATIVALANGQEVTRFNGPLNRLSIPGARDFSDGASVTFAVGSTNTRVLYQSVELTEFPEGRPAAEGWQELFNGRDLAGWTTYGNGKWKVDNGILIAPDQERGRLGTDDDFDDFELELDYRMTSDGNSGIFLRVPPQETISGNDFLELQLLDDNSQKYAAVPPSARNLSLWQKAAPLRPVPPTVDAWHRLYVRALGPDIQVRQDGEVVLETTLTGNFAKHASGRIGLQSLDGAVAFRNIRIRRISSRMPQPAPVGTTPFDRNAKSIDLLPMIDPGQHALDPGVRKENGVIITPPWNNTSTRVVVPFRPVPAEYDIRLVAERKGEDRFGLNLGFVMGGRQAVLDMDGSTPPKWCVSLIDGKSMQNGNVTTVVGKRFPLGKKVAVVLQVRRDRVTVVCDGETVIDWQGRPEQLSLWERIMLPDPDTLFFYSQAEFAIHELMLTPVGISEVEQHHGLIFDGVDDAVSFSQLTVDPTDPFTVELIATVPVQNHPLAVLIGNLRTQPIKTAGMMVSIEQGQVRYTLSRSDRTWVVAGSIRSPARPMHIAAVWDGAVPRLFIEGKEQTAAAVGGGLPLTEQHVNTLLLGSMRWGPRAGTAHGFRGMIHGLRISSTARYDKNFSPPPDFTADQATRALYQFNENSGEILHDSAGQGQHGTIHGATWPTTAAGPSAALQPSAVAVNELNSLDDYILSPWVSTDGRTIYWQNWQAEIRRAQRQNVHAPFGSPETVGSGRHPTLSADERLLVYLDKVDNREVLFQSTRTSSTAAWSPGQVIEELQSQPNVKSPSLSIDGLTLYFQQGPLGQVEIVKSTRPSRNAPWSAPVPIPGLNQQSFGPSVEQAPTWPRLDAEERTVWFTLGGAYDGKLMTSHRTSTTEPFSNFEPIVVDGQPLEGRGPFYCLATNELFYSYSPQRDGRYFELWRIKEEEVPASLPAAGNNENPEIRRVSVAEPPPLEEWLQGRDVLTVSQDGTAMFTTIQDALNAQQDGQVVHVLDRGPYLESLSWNDRTDCGLISTANTVIHASDWRLNRKGAPEKLLHKFDRLSNCRLHGFAFLVTPRDDNDRNPLLFYDVQGQCIEHCQVVLTNSMPGDWKTSVQVFSRDVATELRQPMCVRDCLWGVSLHVVNRAPKGAFTIARNWFHAPHVTNKEGIELLISLPPSGAGTAIRVERNVIERLREGGRSVRFDGSASPANLFYEHNTLMAPISSALEMEGKPDWDAFIQDNLHLVKWNRCTFYNSATPFLPLARQRWNIARNYSTGPSTSDRASLPLGDAAATQAIQMLSQDPLDANYLRVDPASITVPDGDPFPGALPPGPAPAGGDWFSRLQDRYRETLELIGPRD